MATLTKDIFRYRRRLSQPLSELIANPLSEFTRKLQVGLLVAATVTLLFSVGIATVTEVSTLGVKIKLDTSEPQEPNPEALKLEAPKIAKWFAFAATSYLLIAYLLGVCADLAITRTKGWSLFASIEGIKTAMADDLKELTEAAKKRSRRFGELQAEATKIENEAKARREAINERLEAIKQEMSIFPERYELLANEREELGSSLLATYNEEAERKAPIDAAIGKLHNEGLVDPIFLDWINERIDFGKALSSFRRLTQLRIVLEITFPAIYSVFVLVSPAFIQ